METKNKTPSMKVCANCDRSLDDELSENEAPTCSTSRNDNSVQVTQFLVCFSDCERSVTLFEALNSVFNLNPNKIYRDHKVVNDDFRYNGLVVMCVKCAEAVANLYKSYVALMELSEGSGMITKVLRQAHLWHLRNGSCMEETSAYCDPDTEKVISDNHHGDHCSDDAGIGFVNKSMEDMVQDDSDEFENGVNSVLSIDFTEGDQTSDLVHPNLVFSKSGQELELIKTVPKKRKIYDEELGRTMSRPLKISRRKNANPIKVSVSASAIIGNESNLRRSDRRRVSSLCQSPAIKLKHEAEEELSDQSDLGQFEPPPRKRKKVTGRYIRTKVKLKGNIKRRRRKGAIMDDVDGTNVKRQRTTGSPTLKIPCTSCDKTFNYHWMMDHHIQLVHQNKKPRSCSVCGFKYFTFRMFDVHHCIPKESQAEERLERPFRCKFCGKTLINRGHFAAHCGSHDVDEDMRYKCPYPDCKLTFKFPKNLVKHEKTHLEEKSWQCSVCGKVFRVKRNLTIHMEIHKEEKKYLCPTCGERFAQRRGLFRHLNTHGSNLKHKCPICGKGFKRKDHVTQHLNSKVHPKTQIDGIQTASEEGLENSNLPLLTFDAEPAEILPDNPPSPTSTSQPPLQPQHLVSLQQPHNFISNPSVVLSQHPTEFAFSDLLTL